MRLYIGRCIAIVETPRRTEEYHESRRPAGTNALRIWNVLPRGPDEKASSETNPGTTICAPSYLRSQKSHLSLRYPSQDQERDTGCVGSRSFAQSGVRQEVADGDGPR